MRTVLANVLKNADSSYPDQMEADTNYQVGQKLYFEYPYNESIYRNTTGIAEFEVTDIVLNTLINPHETMLEVKTDDAEYKNRLPEADQQFLIFESDIDRYLAKNTELLHEMRGQMAQSLYSTGTRYANVELDNGRHIAINEIKDEKGNFQNRYKVSLYANSDEIQQGIFKDTHHVLRLFEGSESVDFLYQTLKTALQVNENIKTPEYFRESVAIENPVEKTPKKNPSVQLLENESAVLVSNAHGESIKLNMKEFWNIVRFGNELDTRKEIEEYLSDIDVIHNIPVFLLTKNEKAISFLTNKVIVNRTYEETGDQIYDTIGDLKTTLADFLEDDIVVEINSFIDSAEEYYGISGRELSNSGAEKLIAQYIFNHDFEPEDSFSDMVYHAIYECQDEIKEHLEKNRNLPLKDKLESIELRKESGKEIIKDNTGLER